MERTERREHERRTDLAVEIVEYSGSEGVLCTSIVDISRGGMRFLASGPETPGAKIEIAFLLPDQETATKVEARVVWARQREPFEVGLRFISPSAAELILT